MRRTIELIVLAGILCCMPTCNNTHNPPRKEVPNFDVITNNYQLAQNVVANPVNMIKLEPIVVRPSCCGVYYDTGEIVQGPDYIEK